MIVDSQCHASLTWYEPIETLLYQMDANGVSRAVLVQHLGEYDNIYLLHCRQQHSDRFAVVAGVDPSDSRSLDQVKQLADAGAAGIRLRPTARSAGNNPLAIWEVAQACGLAVSCVGMSSVYQAAEFASVVEAVPKLTIVLEHLGGASKPDTTQEEQQARQYVLDLARFGNVFIKVPGLGEMTGRINAALAHEQMHERPCDTVSAAAQSHPLHMPTENSPFGADVPEALVNAFKLFSPQRMMWGSDFPVVSSREGYANSLRLCREVFLQLPTEDRDEIFDGVANRIFFSR